MRMCFDDSFFERYHFNLFHIYNLFRSTIININFVHRIDINL